jgi:hypothetical protein
MMIDMPTRWRMMMTTSREKREYNRRWTAAYESVANGGPTDITEVEVIQYLSQFEAIVAGTLPFPDLVMPNGKKPDECSPEYVGKFIATMHKYGMQIPKPPIPGSIPTEKEMRKSAENYARSKTMPKTGEMHRFWISFADDKSFAGAAIIELDGHFKNKHDGVTQAIFKTIEPWT